MNVGDKGDGEKIEKQFEIAFENSKVSRTSSSFYSATEFKVPNYYNIFHNIMFHASRKVQN